MCGAYNGLRFVFSRKVTCPRDPTSPLMPESLFFILPFRGGFLGHEIQSRRCFCPCCYFCLCVFFCFDPGDYQLPGGPSRKEGYQQPEEGRPGMDNIGKTKRRKFLELYMSVVYQCYYRRRSSYLFVVLLAHASNFSNPQVSALDHPACQIWSHFTEKSCVYCTRTRKTLKSLHSLTARIELVLSCVKSLHV